MTAMPAAKAPGPADRIETALRELGFHRSKEVLVRERTSELLCWVGLNRAKRGRAVAEVNPVVGIRYQPLERMVAELRAMAFNPAVPATLAKNIGYLSGRGTYECYLFEAGGDWTPTVEECVERVVAVSEAFAERHLTLEQITSTLASKEFRGPETGYRLPVALRLLRSDEDAERELALELVKLGTRTDPAAQRYREFAERFRRGASVP